MTVTSKHWNKIKQQHVSKQLRWGHVHHYVASPPLLKTSFISKHVGGDLLLVLWERNVVSFLSDQQDQALNSPGSFFYIYIPDFMILKCFYLLKGLGCRQPSSQTLLLQSHAFEWSADKKKVTCFLSS